MQNRVLLTSLSLISLSGVINAEDAPQPSAKKELISNIPHVWISEGVICMKAKESGLSFANQSQNTSALNFTNTPSIQPHFRWNTGIQIDLGFQPKQQYYFASWVYIQNTAQSSHSVSGSEGFFPLLSLNSHLTASSFVTSGNARWQLNTQLADGGTMFPWRPHEAFLLKTHVGLRLASLNQKLKVYYGGGIYNQGTDVLSMRNNFLGIGPRLGIIPQFFLPAGFSLCGEFSAFGLLGRSYVKQQELYLKQSLFHQTHVNARFRFGLDAKAYLAWQKEILYKAIVLSGQIGWQWHEFFSQNHLEHNRFYPSKGHGDLLYHGGFISLCAAF